MMLLAGWLLWTSSSIAGMTSASVSPAVDATGGAERVLVIHAAGARSAVVDTLLALLRHFPIQVEVYRMDEIGRAELPPADKAILLEEGGRSEAGVSLSRRLEQTGVPHLWIYSGDANERIGLIQLHYGAETFPIGSIYASRLNEDIVREADDVLAYATDGQENVPLVVRNDRVWHIAAGMENEPMIALVADLLHDFLEQAHREERMGLLILEHIHPLVPPEQLIAIANLAARYRLPFAAAIIPIYQDENNGIVYSALDDPEWIEAVAYMVDAGGAILLDSTGYGALPDVHFAERIEQGLAVLSELRLYPIGITATDETLAAIRSEAYAVRANGVRFSTVYGVGARSPIPYATYTESGQRFYPNTAGSLKEPYDIGRIGAEAGRMRYVRDGWITFTYDVTAPHEWLEEALQRLADERIHWVDIRYDHHEVESDWLRLVAPGDGTLDADVTDPGWMRNLTQIERNPKWLQSFTLYSLWLLVGIVLLFVIMFFLLMLVLRLRRRNRLFAERELP